jgi:hypothetical protein
VLFPLFPTPVLVVCLTLVEFGVLHLCLGPSVRLLLVAPLLVKVFLLILHGSWARLMGD